uniref:Gustatory receptor n=1 Tax=Strigamia maritima TaxID=126957 RepID=T1JKT4_STRMM
MAVFTYIIERRLKLIWYYVFLAYGITISTDKKHQKYPVVKKCFYIVFLALQIISCSFVSANIFFSYYDISSTATSIAMTVVILLTHINTLAASIVLRMKQEKISFYLHKLITLLRKSTKLSDVWRLLIIHLSIFILHAVISMVLYGVNFETNQKILYSISLSKNETLDVSKKFLNYNYVKTLIYIRYLLWYLVFYTYSGFSIILCTYSCRLMSKNFKILNMSIESSLTAARVTNEGLNKIFQKYEKLCKLTSKLSVLFSPLLLLWSAGGLTIICLSVRALKSNLQIGEYVPFVTMLMYIFREMVLLIMLHNQAKDIHTEASATAVLISKLRPDKSLCVKTNHRTDIKVSQLLFVAQIQDQKIGVNVSGLFTITNTTLLSMLGTLLTYAIIIYQTK